jgi:hypothetical protein
MSEPTPDPAPAEPPPAADRPQDPLNDPIGAGIDFTDPNSPLAPFYASLSGILAVLVIGGAFALYGLLPMMHTDVWGHMAYGRWITENGRFPDREPLSPFTDQSATMYHQAWLSQVLYHGAYTWGRSGGGDDRVKQFAGGGELVRQLHVFAATGMLAALWFAFRRSADSAALAILGVLLVVAGGLIGLGLFRPQIFGQVLFAVFLAVVSRPTPSKAAVVAVPLLLAVWVNLHGSFAVGFAVLGLAWIGRVIEAVRAVERGRVKAVFTDTAVRRLTLAIVLGLGAVCLNPAGPRVYLSVLSFGSQPNLKTLQEWQPLDYSNPGTGYNLYIALCVLLLVLHVLAARPLRPTHYLFMAVFGLAPLFQQRMLTWWLLVSVWLMMPLLADVARRWKWELPRSVPSLRKTALAVVVAVPFLLLSPLFTWLAGGGPPPLNRVYVNATPLELAGVLANPAAKHSDRVQPLADVLTKGYAGKPLGPVFCSPEIGEFLLWRNIDAAPPVRYTHAHLFTEEHWLGCARASLGIGWWEFMDRYRVNLIAVEADLYPQLIEAVGKSDAWTVVLNEPSGPPRARLFVALRKEPK